MVMACVFDPLLPGVCWHASFHTLFLDPLFFLLCFIYFVFRITLLFSLLFVSYGILKV